MHTLEIVQEQNCKEVNTNDWDDADCRMQWLTAQYNAGRMHFALAHVAWNCYSDKAQYASMSARNGMQHALEDCEFACNTC